MFYIHSIFLFYLWANNYGSLFQILEMCIIF